HIFSCKLAATVSLQAGFVPLHLQRASARSITVVILYFGYARGDRKVVREDGHEKSDTAIFTYEVLL
uniref:Ribose-phosphate pyrophosphokinase N-terminal domain-containing protein n=1 Tax=Triticum urartu TaxID=4572 RepID=A0A8R7P0G3_TRIUA